MKLTVISALEQFSGAALSLGLLDLDQIDIDEISHVIDIEGFTMLVDQCLVESEHLFTILCDFLLCLSFSGKVLFEKNRICQFFLRHS